MQTAPHSSHWLLLPSPTPGDPLSQYGGRTPPTTKVLMRNSEICVTNRKMDATGNRTQLNRKMDARTPKTLISHLGT